MVCGAACASAPHSSLVTTAYYGGGAVVSRVVRMVVGRVVAGSTRQVVAAGVWWYVAVDRSMQASCKHSVLEQLDRLHAVLFVRPQCDEQIAWPRACCRALGVIRSVRIHRVAQMCTAVMRCFRSSIVMWLSV